MFFSKLESLRGIAACLVVLYHSPFSFRETSIEFIANGYLFVDLFFILSGFVMTHAYQKKIAQGFSFKNYFVLRLGRVYPLHLFMLLVWVPYILVKYYLYSKNFGGSEFLGSNWQSFLANLFLSHSFLFPSELSWNYPSWSISAEMVAYIVFFLMLVTLDKHQTILLPLFIAAICYWYLSQLGYTSLDIGTKFGFLRAIAGFYLGVFLLRLLLLSKVAFFMSSIAKQKYFFMVELLLIALTVICVSKAEHSIIFLIATILCFTLLVMFFSQESRGCISNILNLQSFRLIGLWSYSIYMVHAIIVSISSNIIEYILKFDLSKGFGFYSVMINFVLLTICIIASKYTFELIEEKWRKRSREFVQKK